MAVSFFDGLLIKSWGVMGMLFSIVMACYNGEKTIARAIESIISQSDYGYELILVDDCSTDSTPDILESYRVIDGRIKVLRTVRNSGGPATPKNLGVSCAVGDVIMFCDQDDQYLPGRIKEFGDVFSTRADLIMSLLQPEARF